MLLLQFKKKALDKASSQANAEWSSKIADICKSSQSQSD